ncbi:MAG: hypothetical protein KBT06_05515 [Prevotellaceae bacterium]|nr:hypothetical protein [Candidatus Colivivens equi]
MVLYETENDPGYAEYVFIFPNGFGACVYKNQESYGFKDDLWAFNLIDPNCRKEDMCLADEDTFGCLTDFEVNCKLEMVFEGKIKELLQDD